MLESLDPFQQVLLGVSSIGIVMILIVVFLTASPNFENTDRLKKILDFLENKKWYLDKQYKYNDFKSIFAKIIIRIIF